jgi:hypothetical protein
MEVHKVVTRRGSHIYLDNRLTDGGEVSLTRRPHFTPRKITGTYFYYRLSRLQSHNAAGRNRSIEKLNDLIGNRNRDLGEPNHSGPLDGASLSQ